MTDHIVDRGNTSAKALSRGGSQSRASAWSCTWLPKRSFVGEQGAKPGRDRAKQGWDLSQIQARLACGVLEHITGAKVQLSSCETQSERHLGLRGVPSSVPLRGL